MLTSHGVGDLQAVQWQGRTGGSVEAAGIGESPLLLPQSPDHANLAQVVRAWSDGGFQRGLLWAPPLLAVVLGRWSSGHKIHTAVTLSEVNIPVWGECQARTWCTYKVRSGVLGAEVTSGHYRSFWFCPDHDTLLTGDDAVRPTTASASDTKRVEEGIVFTHIGQTVKPPATVGAGPSFFAYSLISLNTHGCPCVGRPGPTISGHGPPHVKAKHAISMCRPTTACLFKTA